MAADDGRDPAGFAFLANGLAEAPPAVLAHYSGDPDLAASDAAAEVTSHDSRDEG